MEYWQKLRQAVGHETIILSGAAGAILQEDKILLARHGTFKKWYIPGGLQEPGESIQDTVCREIKEELGLELEVDKLISIHCSAKWITEYPNGDKVQQLLFFFLMKGYVRKIELQVSELIEWDWFPLNAIPENMMDCCKQKVEDLRHFQGEVFLR